MKETSGKVSIILGVVITIYLYTLSKDSLNFGSPLNLLSQVFALIGFCLLTYSLVLSTKSGFLEEIFGGLDRLYSVHRFSGSLAFVLIINHPLLLVVNALPDVKLASIYSVPSGDLAYNLGIFALYTMLLSFIFMVFVKIPYQYWKLTHQLLGISFLLGGIHMLLVPGDVSGYLPLKIWMFAHLLAGIISFSYITFLFESFGPQYRYRVTDIDKVGDIVSVLLSPIGRKLNFYSGQFVYISIKSKGMGKELHPFTVSSAPEEEVLRISSKIVGDYTLKLPGISKDAEIVVYGPYGKFSKKFFESDSEAVWIAGGIGVTPFLSLARNSDVRQQKRKINFYYCFRGEEEAVFEREISHLTTFSKNMNFIPWDTTKNNRLSADLVCRNLQNPSGTLIQICGPQRMMEDFRMQFLAKGVKEGNIVFENFQLI